MGEEKSINPIGPKTSVKRDGLDALIDLFIGDDPEMIAGLEQARYASLIAQVVYDLREAEGLTQRELADRVGTTEQVIDDLEEADYEGPALTMLQRIGKVFGQRVVLKFEPVNVATPGAKPEADAIPVR